MTTFAGQALGLVLLVAGLEAVIRTTARFGSHPA